MERAKYKSASSKLILALVALFVCGGWALPGYADAQASQQATSASEEVLVPLARAVLAQPMNGNPEVEADAVVPVLAARWSAADEAQLWLSASDPKLAAAGLLVLLAGLFAGAAVVRAYRSRKARSDADDGNSHVNRPSYV